MQWILKKMGMDSILQVVTLVWLVTILVAADNKPEVQRSRVYIYRKTSMTTVKIYHCFYNDTRNAYYDITEHCLQAFKTGVFIDKWKDRNNLRRKGSSVIRLEEYTAKADLLTNQIFLRSGTRCKYDRGFCYDTKEALDYAVVWEVVSSTSQKCPDELEQVFYGFVDLWNFKNDNSKYLFYYDQSSDRSFYLYLGNTTTNCYNKDVWSAGDEFLVTKWHLTETSQQTLPLNEEFFPLRPKKNVTEAIFRDYDLRVYPFDFDKKIVMDHLSNYNNLKSILKRYQDLILEAGMKINQLSSNESNSDNIDNLRRSIADAKVTLMKMETEIRQVNQKCIQSQSDLRSTRKELMNLKNILEKMNPVEYDLFALAISKIYDKLHQEGDIVSDRVDSQAGDLIKFQQNLDDLDIAVRNQMTDFIMKEELDDILFDLEGKIIQNLENYKNNLSDIIDKKGPALMELYGNGERNISDRYEELTLKINQFNGNLNNKANKLEQQMESKLQLLRTFLVSEVDYSNQNILPKIDVIKNNLTDLQNKLNECKLIAVDSIQMLKSDLSSLQDNISTIHQLSVKNDVKVTQLTKKLYETVEDINEEVEDIQNNYNQYVSQKELPSILAASETDARDKFEELAKNLTLVEMDHENKMKAYFYTEIEKKMVSYSREMESTCEDSVQVIENNFHFDLIDLQKQVFINVSAIKFNLEILSDDMSKLEEDLEGKIDAITKITKDLKIDVNDCKGDLIKISRAKHGIFSVVKDNITELFKNTDENYNNLIKFELKLSELENNYDRIEQLSLKSSVEFVEDFNKAKDTIGAELSIKLNELLKSSFGNWSMLKSEMNSIRENIEYNDELTQANIEQTTTDMEVMKQVIENHKQLLLNSSMKNEEVSKYLLNNVSEIQNEITLNGGSIFQIDIDLTKVRSNITDLFRNISEIANDRTRTEESLNKLFGGIREINDTLRNQIGVSKITVDEIEKIINNIHSIDENITNNGNIIRELKDTYSKNIISSQLLFDNVSEHLYSYRMGISKTLVQNEESLKKIRRDITDNKLRLAKGDLEMKDMKSQMQIIQEKLEVNENAVEDVETSTRAFVNARLVSFKQEIAQIHSMILNDESNIQKIENEMSQLNIKNNCCETMEQKLRDYENTIDELKNKLSTAEKELDEKNTDLDQRLKNIEFDLYAEPILPPSA